MKPLRLKRSDLPKKIRKSIPEGPNKFNAQPQIRDGRRIASTAEARRLAELKLEERAGGISDLRTQVKFPLRCNGHDLEALAAWAKTRTEQDEALMGPEEALLLSTAREIEAHKAMEASKVLHIRKSRPEEIRDREGEE